MSSLLSVLFVASSANNGSRLLFAYPPDARATPRVQRPLYGKSLEVRRSRQRSSSAVSALASGDAPDSDGEDELGSSDNNDDVDNDDQGRQGKPALRSRDMFGTRFIRGESSSSSSGDEQFETAQAGSAYHDNQDYTERSATLSKKSAHFIEDEYATREQRDLDSLDLHLGMDVNTLGKMLCPRKELCNKRFEMVINHLAFIAHPAVRRPKRRHSRAPSREARHANSSRSSKGKHRLLSRYEESAVTVSDDADSSEDDHESIPRALDRTNRLNRARRQSSSISSSSVASSVLPSRRGSTSVPAMREHGNNGSQSRSSQLRESVSSQIRPSHIYAPDRNIPAHHSHSMPPADLPKTIVSPTRIDDMLKNRSVPPERLPQNAHVPESENATVASADGVARERKSASATSRAANANRPPSVTELDTWAIVLVVDYPPDQHLSYHLGVYYRDIVIPITAGLKFEERQNQFVSKQAEIILALRERAEEAGHSLAAHSKDLIIKSSLCAQLAAMYNGIKSSGVADLTFNDDIDMSVLLHTELWEDPKYCSGAATSRYTGSGANSPFFRLSNRHSRVPLTAVALGDRLGTTLQQRQQLASAFDAPKRLDLARLTSVFTGGLLDGAAPRLVMLPWQTLLPLGDPAAMLEEVEADGLLARFLEIMHPQLTFTEYETLLDTDSANILEIAQHLIYWRRARLIDAISVKAMYLPTRTHRADHQQLLAEYAVRFSSQFHDMPPLPIVLAEMSSPQALEIHIANFRVTKATGLDAVTWLLQEGLAMQCHEYLSLAIPSSLKSAAQNALQTAKEHGIRAPGTRATFNSFDDVELEEGGRPIQRSDTGLTGISEVESDLSHDINSSRFAESSDASGIQMAVSAEARSRNTTIRSPLSPHFPSTSPYLVKLAQSSPSHGKPLHDRDVPKSEGKACGAATLSLSPTVVAYPGEPSAEEEMWIAQLVKTVEAAHGATSTQAFISILPWLDGSHHIDEILYRTNLHRSALRLVLNDYAGYIISFVS